MKTLFSIFVPVIFIGFFLKPALPVSQSMQKSESTYPAEVKKVIDGKCYGCHSDKGKSQDAKDALLWDSLLNLPKSSQIATLDEIIKVLNENKMPPEGAVKKNPEMKLSPEEIRILKSWAESRADNMMK
jgi:mono/diheme cytochrome c family protein